MIRHSSARQSNAGESYLSFGRAPDDDGDGIYDLEDNCLNIANQHQRDTDDDGFGNACDPDLNNDEVGNFLAIAQWSIFFNTNAKPVADFNGNGVTHFSDYAVLVEFFQLPPGPSGLNPID